MGRRSGCGPPLITWLLSGIADPLPSISLERHKESNSSGGKEERTPSVPSVALKFIFKDLSICFHLHITGLEWIHSQARAQDF